MQLSEIKNIAVIGAGMMGHGIAQIFAAGGFSVSLQSPVAQELEKAMENIRANLTIMARHGAANEADIEPLLARIKTTRDMQEAARDARFVIEAVPEDMDLKQEIFRELDNICAPDTVLTTNTSVMSITEIARKAQNRRRIIGTHFWNPPYLLPLVEVVRTEEAAPEVVALTCELLKSVGKHPVIVKKDVPGFVANRLQHALWREAVSIVEKGIADADTVDQCVKHSFGLRLPLLGPLETADMAGLDLTLSIHEYIFKYLDNAKEPSPLLREKVKNGDLGFKTGRGFKEWSLEKTRETRTKLIEYLLQATKVNLSSTDQRNALE